LNQFDENVEEVMKTRFKEYDNVKKDFQKFFNEKLLSLELANKADIDEIN